MKTYLQDDRTDRPNITFSVMTSVYIGGIRLPQICSAIFAEAKRRSKEDELQTYISYVSINYAVYLSPVNCKWEVFPDHKTAIYEFENLKSQCSFYPDVKLKKNAILYFTAIPKRRIKYMIHLMTTNVEKSTK